MPLVFISSKLRKQITLNKKQLKTINNPKKMYQFFQHFTDNQTQLFQFFSPGRVNLIGEHTDYNGGWVLPIAINLGLTAQVQYNESKVINIITQAFPDTLSINLLSETFNKSSTLWHNYALGIVQQLMANEVSISGVNIYITSTLPLGSGLSSSAAFQGLLASILLYNTEHPLKSNPIGMVKLCQKSENEFVGLPCGILDPFAVIMSQENNAILLNCSTLQYNYLPFSLPNNLQLVVINTNKPRNLVQSKYSERKEECDKALNIMQQYNKKLTTISEASQKDISNIGDPVLRKRAMYILGENKRVLAFSEALAINDWTGIEKIMSDSNYSLKNNYETTGKELDTLTEICRTTKGCNGSRTTGAGFGGCAIALVQKSNFDDFCNKVNIEYNQKIGTKLSFYAVNAVNGVGIVKDK